nr:hypothetical protein [Alysiella crassa]
MTLKNNSTIEKWWVYTTLRKNIPKLNHFPPIWQVFAFSGSLKT